MKIREIRAAGLRGASPEGGWTDEILPDDCVHTLIVIHTDEGVTGYGSVFTNDRLVKAALAGLEPLYRGENALEPERVSEKLHQNTFWMGRGGTLTHTISGIDIALWDILGKVTGQPVGRLLGGRYRQRVRPYASILIAQDRLAGRRTRRQVHPPRLEHGHRSGRRPAAGLGLRPHRLCRIPDRLALYRRARRHPWRLDADGMVAIPDGPGLGIELDLEAVRKYTAGEEF